MTLMNVIAIYLLFPSTLMALNISPCAKPKTHDFRSIIHKASVIGPEDRKTFAEYAKQNGLSEKDVEKKFGATGVLLCDNHHVTAQLAGNYSVIVTAGHAFQSKDCQSRNLKACNFAYRVGSKFKQFKVDIKSLRLGGCKKDDDSLDWAVLKLSEPADKRAFPYQLPNDGLSISPGQKVIQVAGFSDNFKNTQGTPKNIVECNIMDTQIFDGYPLQTNCDSGGGTSGSAQLIQEQNGRLTIAAIHIGDTLNKDGLPYDKFKNFNISVPVSGEFLQTIKQAVAETGGEK